MIPFVFFLLDFRVKLLITQKKSSNTAFVNDVSPRKSPKQHPKRTTQFGFYSQFSVFPMQYFGNFLIFGIPRKKNGPALKNVLVLLLFVSVFVLSGGSAIGQNKENIQKQQNGIDILLESIRKFSTWQTIQCEIRLSTFVDGVEFPAKGKYEEQKIQTAEGIFQNAFFRQDISFPMDMPLSPGAEANRMAIVCYCPEDRQNGRVWMYKSIEGQKTLDFVRLSTLEDSIRQAQLQAYYPDVATMRKLGALAGTLREIEYLYDFSGKAVKDQLETDKKKSVWRIRGILRTEHLKKLLTQMGLDQTEGQGGKGTYPVNLPTDIEVCIGQADFFPYRIRYLNRNSEKSQPEEILTEIVYFNVNLNGEAIPEYRFETFKQDRVFSFRDISAEFLTGLGLPVL